MEIKHVLMMFELLRQLDSEMSIAQAQCFLVVAKAGDKGIPMTDLGNAVRIGSATCSRYIGDLGQINRYREPGLDLVIAKENPMERRTKIVMLTAKGRKLITKIFGSIESAEIAE